MMTAGIIKEDLPVIRREFVIMEVWIFNSKFFKSLSLQKLLFNFCLRSRPGGPNVVCQSISSNVDTDDQSDRVTELPSDHQMTE